MIGKPEFGSKQDFPGNGPQRRGGALKAAHADAKPHRQEPKAILGPGEFLPQSERFAVRAGKLEGDIADEPAPPATTVELTRGEPRPGTDTARNPRGGKILPEKDDDHAKP